MDKRILAIVAVGLAGGTASAQPFVVNISGATLLENFCSRQSSTTDFLDVDGDGIAGSLGSPGIDQLASPNVDPFVATQYWAVQYRAVGSVNGFIELTAWGSSFATQPGDILVGAASNAYYNTDRYINASVLEAPANAGNPGGAPVTSDTSTLSALRSSNGTFSGGGIRIDIAPCDVSSRWATQRAGSAATPYATPAQAGYGERNRPSRRRDGTAGGLASSLPGLNGRNLFDPSNPGAADGNTLFDTRLTFAPIAAAVNYGVGRSEVAMTELQHLFATGRMPSGENLMAVTRDAGSGTRNGFMNCIGVDPSWGRGDDVGGLAGAPSNSQAEDEVGGRWVPNNKSGNGNVQRTVQNARLAVGYTGPESGVSGSYPGSWMTRDAMDVLAVRHDAGSYGGSAAVRPTAANILSGAYAIGGPAVLITLGDPRNQNELGGDAANAHPRMRNPYAASYVNNVTRSTEAFVAGTGDPNNDFMPGQYLATQFILTPALERVHDQATPTRMNANGAYNAALNAFTAANSVLANAEFAAFNGGTAGRTPRRLNISVGAYSDGTQGQNYVDMDGAAVTEDSVLPVRNKVAFDFNGDGVRSGADVAAAVAAWRHRHGGPAWTAPDGVYGAGSGRTFVIEVTGDVNSDGSYDAEDLRYYADGLHLVNGRLDRRAGFTAVDAAFGGNFFGTAKSTGAAYQNGDSRADVAGAAGTAPGFAPVGADGVIGRADLAYVKANVVAGQATGGSWADLATAAEIDLSCDLTGDLRVDQDDLAELYAVLGTCAVDFNLDGFIDFFDYDDFVSGFEHGDPLTDYNNDGFIDFFDYDDYVSAFEAGC